MCVEIHASSQSGNYRSHLSCHECEVFCPISSIVPREMEGISGIYPTDCTKRFTEQRTSEELLKNAIHTLQSKYTQNIEVIGKCRIYLDVLQLFQCMHSLFLH